ncbi:MAG: hypothetical protein WBM98_02945, partial [Maribacter sp.]|uniref:hypothetical protein n=1 Tax=Maribacter sp. TaxID=1897614 RepID=UPI003C779C68
MKNSTKKKKVNLLGIYVLIFALLVFNVGCSDDDGDSIDEVTDEVVDDDTADDDSTYDDLTINNYLMIASGQTNLYNADGDQVTSLS